MEEEIAALNRQINELRATVEALTVPRQIVYQEYRVSLSEAISQIRKFSGTTDVNNYLQRLECNLEELNLDKRWILANFDRILEGSARSWWESKQGNVMELLEDPDTDFDNEWLALKDEMLNFFSSAAQIQDARTKNRALKFLPGGDVQKYIAEKIRLLHIMDPKAKDDKKVEQLIRGLPVDLQEPMTLIQCQNAAEFQNRLTAVMMIRSSRHQEPGVAQKHFTNLPKDKLNFSNYSSPPHGKSGQQGQSKAVTCFYCNKVGHLKKDCRKLAYNLTNKGQQPQNNNQQQYANNGTTSANRSGYQNTNNNNNQMRRDFQQQPNRMQIPRFANQNYGQQPHSSQSMGYEHQNQPFQQQQFPQQNQTFQQPQYSGNGEPW